LAELIHKMGSRRSNAFSSCLFVRAWRTSRKASWATLNLPGALFIQNQMDLELRGKRALVTGSTAGIGFAIAQGLAKEGATVILNGRTERRVEQALAALHKAGVSGTVEGLAADLGTAGGTRTAVERFPEVDILVNNLGIFEIKPFENIPDADWLRLFEVNILSGVRLSRHYLPGMKERNWGRIVFISSESAIQIPAEMIHYGMTKTAQLAIARGLAETTAGTNVTVNSVLPGPTASEGASNFMENLARDQKTTRQEVEKEFFQNMRPTSLLKRMVEPEEVANLVTFVCSPLSSATNGAALRVDGGVVRSIV
jgi:NAD(P)-dependent dehydrogenase (short-subunit alcohol dehydrogenase family)